MAPSADGRLELFLTGADGNIYHSWQVQASDGWSAPWVSEGSAGGGFTAAAPALSRNGDGRLELFAVARDGNLYHKWQTAASNGWSQWAQLVPHAPPPPTTTVPNVLGDTGKNAAAKIHLAGLTVGDISQVNNCVDPGTVQVQNPKGGTTVAQGSTVQFTISTCTGGGHPK